MLEHSNETPVRVDRWPTEIPLTILAALISAAVWIATTEQYLHADVDRLGSVLIRKSPLERGRRKKVVQLRPALEQLLGELRSLGRPT